jgi:hypothetical protein
MSRSNPTDNTPNPCTRWFEWGGSSGSISYYDKEKKENVDVGNNFVFILLDELACVKGWHDASDSGIFSNEVRDTKKDTLLVKAFKGGILAEGFYSNIRDRIVAQGGHFVQNCYIGYKNGNDLALGSIQFKGSALNAWVEFKKACGSTIANGKSIKDIYAKAVKISGFTEGKKGSITYRVPQFSIVPISLETDSAAVKLDETLQAYLTSYLARTKTEQVSKPAEPEAPQSDLSKLAGEPPHNVHRAPHLDDFEDAEVPF